MGLVNRWTALLTLTAGAAAAAGVSRRRHQPGRRMPRMTGVDGLGESLGADTPEQPTLEAPVDPSPAADPPAVPEPDAAAEDSIAALDSARDRLRRQADELRREIGGA